MKEVRHKKLYTILFNLYDILESKQKQISGCQGWGGKWVGQGGSFGVRGLLYLESDGEWL